MYLHEIRQLKTPPIEYNPYSTYGSLCDISKVVDYCPQIIPHKSRPLKQSQIPIAQHCQKPIQFVSRLKPVLIYTNDVKRELQLLQQNKQYPRQIPRIKQQQYQQHLPKPSPLIQYPIYGNFNNHQNHHMLPKKPSNKLNDINEKKIIYNRLKNENKRNCSSESKSSAASNEKFPKPLNTKPNQKYAHIEPKIKFSTKTQQKTLNDKNLTNIHTIKPPFRTIFPRETKQPVKHPHVKTIFSKKPLEPQENRKSAIQRLKKESSGSDSSYSSETQGYFTGSNTSSDENSNRTQSILSNSSQEVFSIFESELGKKIASKSSFRKTPMPCYRISLPNSSLASDSDRSRRTSTSTQNSSRFNSSSSNRSKFSSDYEKSRQPTPVNCIRSIKPSVSSQLTNSTTKDSLYKTTLQSMNSKRSSLLVSFDSNIKKSSNSIWSSSLNSNERSTLSSKRTTPNSSLNSRTIRDSLQSQKSSIIRPKPISSNFVQKQGSNNNKILARDNPIVKPIPKKEPTQNVLKNVKNRVNTPFYTIVSPANMERQKFLKKQNLPTNNLQINYPKIVKSRIINRDA